MRSEQAKQLQRMRRVEELKRIVAGAAWYTQTERSVAERLLATLYKEGA
jgi:DNA repair ATPase RecN